jgi:NADH-quinone oxidoreductase subunit C
MSESRTEQLAATIKALALEGVRDMQTSLDHVTVTVEADNLIDVATALRDGADTAFDQLIDVCGVDYLQYGKDEWATDSTASAGFSRGVDGQSIGRLSFGDEVSSDLAQGARFAVVYQLLSIERNARLTLKVFAPDNDFPVVPSVTAIWSCADWPEREAFDLLGIHFEGHPDLRRLLTDYGFVGHPFRKDFPLVGNVEMRYDPLKKRVIYEPVTIEPRVLVPRVIRQDNRYVTHDAATVEGDGETDA